MSGQQNQEGCGVGLGRGGPPTAAPARGAGPQPSLPIASATWGFFFFLIRETHTIGFSAAAEQGKPGSQAVPHSAPPARGSRRRPGPPAPRGCPHPTLTSRWGTDRAAARPSPGRGRRRRQHQPRARHRPRYVPAGRPAARAGPATAP